jgi:hypothetical protein
LPIQGDGSGILLTLNTTVPTFLSSPGFTSAETSIIDSEPPPGWTIYFPLLPEDYLCLPILLPQTLPSTPATKFIV